MTEPPITPERAKEILAPALRSALETIRTAWETIRPVALELARCVETRAAAQEAIGHAYDEEGEQVTAALEALDDDQLQEVEQAAAALFVHARRIRIAREEQPQGECMFPGRCSNDEH